MLVDHANTERYSPTPKNLLSLRERSEFPEVTEFPRDFGGNLPGFLHIFQL